LFDYYLLKWFNNRLELFKKIGDFNIEIKLYSKYCCLGGNGKRGLEDRLTLNK